MYKVPIPLGNAEKWPSKRIYLLPKSRNLRILCPMAKDVIKLRILRCEGHPGLTWQALNPVTCF